MNINNNEYKRTVKGINMDGNLENIISFKLEQFDEIGSGFKAFLMKKSSFIAIIGVILLGILFISAVIFSLSNMYPITPKGVVEGYFEAMEQENYEQVEGFIRSDNILNHSMFNYDARNKRTIYKGIKDSEDKRGCSVLVVIEYSNQRVNPYLFWLRKIDNKWYIFNWEKLEE